MIRAASPSARPAASLMLPAVLSFVAGMVDVIGYLTLGGVFTAHITGNIVVFAAVLAQDGGLSHLTPILLLPVFVLSVLVADQLTYRSTPQGECGGRPLLIVQFGLLSAAAVSAWVLSPWRDPQGSSAFAVAAIAVAAMAVQNTFLHLSRKNAPTTAVMTGNVVMALVAGLALLRRDADREEQSKHWTATWPLLAGFFSGCLAGTVLVEQTMVYAWTGPAGVALIAIYLNERGRRLPVPSGTAV